MTNNNEHLKCKHCGFTGNVGQFNRVRSFVPDIKGEPNLEPIISCPICYSQDLETVEEK